MSTAIPRSGLPFWTASVPPLPLAAKLLCLPMIKVTRRASRALAVSARAAPIRLAASWPLIDQETPPQPISTLPTRTTAAIPIKPALLLLVVILLFSPSHTPTLDPLRSSPNPSICAVSQPPLPPASGTRPAGSRAALRPALRRAPDGPRVSPPSPRPAAPGSGSATRLDLS